MNLWEEREQDVEADSKQWFMYTQRTLHRGFSWDKGKLLHLAGVSVKDNAVTGSMKNETMTIIRRGD